MNFVNNAFSLQMLKGDCTIKISHIKKREFDQAKKDCISVIGHKETATVLGVPFNRASISLDIGDVVYVAQLIGGRLPEGTTTLPDGFKFKFLKVKVEGDN